MQFPDDLPFGVPEVIATYNRELLSTTPSSYGEHLCETARRTFLDIGELPMIVLLYGQAEPPWLLPQARDLCDYRCAVWAIPLMKSTPESKLFFSRVLPAIARSVRACAVGLAYEGWQYNSCTDEERQKQEAYKAAHEGSIEGYPGVREGLLVTFETRAEALMWTAAIVREPGLDAQVGHFEPMLRDAVHAGRFAGILARAETSAETEA